MPTRRNYQALPALVVALVVSIAGLGALSFHHAERRTLTMTGSCVVLGFAVLFGWAMRRLRQEWRRAQERQEWLDTTLRSIGDAVMSTDAESRITFMNPVAQQLTGWTEEEARGLLLPQVLRLVEHHSRQPHPDPAVSAMQLDAHGDRTATALLLARDGTERRVAEHGRPIRGGDGKIVGAVIVFRDVTEQELGESALRASQEMFRIITDHISDMIVVLDTEGRRLYNSASYARGLAAPSSLYMTKSFADLHPDDRVRVEGIFADILRTGEARRAEYRLKHRNGGFILVESVGNAIHGTDGQSDKVLVVSRDITERAEAEQALRATMRRLGRQNNALSEQARNPTLLNADRQTCFRMLTELAARTLEVNRVSIWFFDAARTAIRCDDLLEADLEKHSEGAELTAADYPKYFAALGEERAIAAHDARRDERTEEFAASYLEVLGITSMLDAPIRAGGRMVGVLCHEHTGPTRIWTPDEQNFAGSIADLIALSLEVAQRRQAEADLREARDGLEVKVIERTRDLEQANERLKELDRLKSEFVATMSHELRTPLNSIIGFTGILRQGLAGPLNEEQLKQLGMVFFSARHLLGLINDLLDLSRIESGKMEVVRDAFDFSEVVEEAMASLAPLAGQKQLRLEKQLSGDLKVCTDRKKCFQVLLNLGNNAVKFTETGSVRFEVEATAGELTISVIDTGIGIQPESMANLFQAFRQVDGSARRVYEGTGLGLYLCRKLVSMLGGSIAAESDFGAGSHFTVVLPREPPSETNPPA